MAGGTAVMTLAYVRAARHCLDTWPYAQQVPHVPAKALGILHIAAVRPRAPQRSHLYTPSLDAPGG